MLGRILPSLREHMVNAITVVLGCEESAEIFPTGHPSFGDYQSNVAMKLAPRLGLSPRTVAQRLVDVLDTGGICQPPEIAGPGFINLRLNSDWIRTNLFRMAHCPRLGVEPVTRPSKIVVDFSSPNVAKRMHVGHLRSTIIGDALVRTLRFLGHDVTGDNHIGDWGTQFGVLIWAFKHYVNKDDFEADPIVELERLYKLGTERCNHDPEVAAACRAELVALQSKDETNVELWKRFVDISKHEADALYERLGVSFETWLGESFYADRLPEVVSDLERRGLARKSEGALVVFFPENESLRPFMIQKSDSAFLYSTTDIATLDYRVRDLGAQRVIYVVDVRQSLHFAQLFATARMLGLAGDFEHVGFGMMLGADGRPFRTRDGGTVGLESLLEEAESRVRPIVQEKWPKMTATELDAISSRVGIGAVKYADLSQNLTSDYRFDWDKLLTFEGNSGPYLQYALVRIQSLLNTYAEEHGKSYSPGCESPLLSASAEIELATRLSSFADRLDSVADSLRPHFLCDYLYGLARSFNQFYSKCPIIWHSDPEERQSRLFLTWMTGRALEIGLECLNIPTVGRM